MGDDEILVVQTGSKTGEFLILPKTGIQEEQMEVLLGTRFRGRDEIRIHLGNGARGSVRLYGVKLMPLEETDGEIRPQFEREEDKTDTGTQEG